MSTKEPGYYVEGTHYGTRIAQARARARLLANEYKRPVEVRVIGHAGTETLVSTHRPGGHDVVETP
jgi:hypothetical protein